MAQFTYSARDKSGALQDGKLFAGDRAAAAAALQGKGLTPILVKEIKDSGGKGGSMGGLFGSFGRVKMEDKVMFTRQFATMINAGVPITQSLGILQRQTSSKKLQVAIEDIEKLVSGGSNLSKAMSVHPQVFDPIYINMVSAGETGGILDEVLNRLATQQEKDAAIKSRIKGAMIYPAVVTVATIAAFFFLMLVIVPGLSGVFANLNATLPWYTNFLLALSHFMVKYWYIMVGSVAAVVILVSRWRKTPKGRRTIDRLMLKAPIFGPILVKVNVARFSRTFGSLMSSGISVVEAINATSLSLSSSVYQDELEAVAKHVKNGRPMSEMIQQSKNFPPIVGQMLTVGEETGQMDTILLKLADFYEEEVDNVIAGLTSVIEPILILVLGGMVGFVVISVFGPLSNLSSTVGNSSN